MLKFSGFMLSALVSALLIGCGDGTSSSVGANSVTVNKGPVYGATVKDSSNPVQIAKSFDNNNVYVFEKNIVYPVKVTGGFIDVDGDGILDDGEANLTEELMSYSKIVTPITTYVAKKAGSKDKVEEEYKKLAEDLGLQDIDDLKKAPSDMKNKASKVASMSIYKEMLDTADDKEIELENLKGEYENLNTLAEGIEDNKDIEKVAFKAIADDGNIKGVIIKDVKNIIREYNLFDYNWKEEKTFSKDTDIFAEGNLFKVDSNKSITLKAVKEKGKRSRTSLKTFLKDKGVNSVDGTFDLTEGGIKSSISMVVVAEVSLDDNLKERYSSIGDNPVLVIYTKIYNNRIYVGVEISGDEGYEDLESFMLAKDLQNTSKSFTINTSYLDGVLKVSVDGIEQTYEHNIPESMNIGEFTVVRFRADVDDRKNKAEDKNAEAKITSFNAKTKELSAALQAMKIVEKTDVEKDNIDTKLDEAKSKVRGLNSNDAIMVSSMLDLANIVNSEEVSTVLEVNASSISETSMFGKLIKATVNDTIKISEKYNGISETSREVMHKLAEQLKTINDNIGKVFESKDYVFKYGTENITYNDSIALRAVILGLAGKLEFISAYKWGSDDDIKTRTKVIDSVEYEYQNIVVNPAESLNRGDVFKIEQASRINTAKAYIITGLEYITSLPKGYDEGLTEDTLSDLSSMLASIKGGEPYKLVEELTQWDYKNNQEVQKEEHYYIDLAKFFDSNYAIDITSFGSKFKNECEISGGEYSEDKSIIEQSEFCSNGPATLEPETSIITSNSKIDDIVTKIVTENGKTLTGQDVIDFILD